MHDLLNKRQLAQRIKEAPRTIDYWRKREGLPLLKIGHTVCFRRPDVMRHRKRPAARQSPGPPQRQIRQSPATTRGHHRRGVIVEHRATAIPRPSVLASRALLHLLHALTDSAFRNRVRSIPYQTVMDLAQTQNRILAAAQAPQKHGAAFFRRVLDSVDDPLCKWHAVKAIGLLKDKRSKRQLLGVFQAPDHDFSESSLHLIAAWAIGQIGASFTPDLVALLSHETSKPKRIALIDALGEIGDPAGIPLLSKQLASKSQTIRLWAALSLAKVGPSSLPVLNQALDTADSELVYIIADALATIGNDATVPALLRAFERDPHALRKYFVDGPAERTARCAALLRKSARLPVGHPLRALADNHLATRPDGQSRK